MSLVTLGKRPEVLPPDSYNRIQRRGINYEKRVARDIVHTYPTTCFILHGQWLYREGAFCQPDLVVIPRKGPVLVLEVKLSRKRDVLKKMQQLYLPWVLDAFPGRPAIAGQIFRNGTGADAFDLDYFLSLTHLQYGEVQWR
jgi:hypothetical protein